MELLVELAELLVELRELEEEMVALVAMDHKLEVLTHGAVSYTHLRAHET